MLEEGKKAGQQADSSLAKIYWTIGDKLKEAGLIGLDHYGESVIEQLAEDLERGGCADRFVCGWGADSIDG
jgi:hypothetical protein